MIERYASNFCPICEQRIDFYTQSATKPNGSKWYHSICWVEVERFWKECRESVKQESINHITL